MYVLLKKTDGASNSSKTLIFWGETQQEVLDQLLLFLVEPQILAYPDSNKDFILHIAASDKGFRAVLLQYQESVI